ncbi:MAG: L-ribulose-5-phosphate 4-epimerase AraD [Actinobacteria bacterium]|nr:L-ribulose-5-phosphate 4-epimerase AraD [Actinomycetota bacterium]
MACDFKELKKKVFDANIKLAGSGLVISTFGNVSGIDRKTQVIAIKPSGIPYSDMKIDDMVLVGLSGEKVEENSPNPSSDTDTHLELYRTFADIRGITHSHSDYATAFAQAKIAIPCLGTTHADYFYGAIPVSEVIKDSCIIGDYELETGKLIVRTFKNRDYHSMKSCLVACHGPFTWGESADDSVDVAIMLEHIAMLAYRSILLDGSVKDIKKTLLDRHYLRKHGENAYYGQNR